MKCKVTRGERYPVFGLEFEGDPDSDCGDPGFWVEVPDEVVLRWKRGAEEWSDTQGLLIPFYDKAEEAAGDRCPNAWRKSV